MGVLKKMGESIRRGLRNWLQIQNTAPFHVQIQGMEDFELAAIRNRIWYRGDGNELEQFYMQATGGADKYKFWAGKCSPGLEMRKIHTGLPGLIVRVLCNIVLGDMADFEFDTPGQEELWKEIAKENNFNESLREALQEVLYIGDGAYKVVVDTKVSPYPILEWYPGEQVEIVQQHKRLKEVVFLLPYQKHGMQYVLYEHYGYGYIHYELYCGEKQVGLDALEETKTLKEYTFDEKTILAVPVKVFGSAKYPGRGGSVFDGKLDSFDAFDETWSQWMDAMRAGRAKTYIPECFIPRNKNNGTLLRPNPFDNRFIETDMDMSEKAQNKIDVEQPAIPHDSYMASYITALDLCLQGLISPSTLGIDVKKLDNALAQREKEKTTLYTRDAIVRALQDALPKVVQACLRAYALLQGEAYTPGRVDIDFGEYANPSFESQIAAISQARQGGIMSIEKAVDELYGNTMDAQCKKEEVARLLAEQGIQELEELAAGQEGAAGGEEWRMNTISQKPSGALRMN